MAKHTTSLEQSANEGWHCPIGAADMNSTLPVIWHFGILGALAMSSSYAQGQKCVLVGDPTPEYPRCPPGTLEAKPKSAADAYLANKANLEASENAAFLASAKSLGLPCDSVVAHVGGEPGVGQPVIVAVVCERSDGKRALYEWIRKDAAPDHKNHVRSATLQQVQDDVETLTKGLGLAGSWWQGSPAEQAAAKKFAAEEQ